MKYIREIKVGILATLCLFLLFFGFNFLKGVNIFTPTNTYYGQFAAIRGLEEQSPVYIRGYKVGQVDRIVYNFAQDTSFFITISIHDDIQLPQGTVMALAPDGLLGGKAIELQLASNDLMAQPMDTLVTKAMPSLVETLETQLLANINQAVCRIDTLVANANKQLEGDHLKQTLKNVNVISKDLSVVSNDMKHLFDEQLPSVVQNVDSAVVAINAVANDIQQANLTNTLNQLDTAVTGVNQIVKQIQTQEGTIGKLLYDTALYQHIDNTIISADSLINDVKKQPKKYINISVFGGRNK